MESGLEEIIKCDQAALNPVVLFTMLNKVVLTVESVKRILKCDHSNESY